MEHRRMSVGPRDVLRLKKPTNGFLCSPVSDIHRFEFLKFSIIDEESHRVLFEIDHEAGQKNSRMELDDESFRDGNCHRAIKYTFNEDILRRPMVAARLIFRVGNQAMHNLRMIERHYFKSQLVKSFDSSFGYCVPGSVNTWNVLYDVPPLDEDLVQEMIAHPFETKSDTFYFVDNELIVHNKSRYRYIKEDGVVANTNTNNVKLKSCH